MPLITTDELQDIAKQIRIAQDELAKVDWARSKTIGQGAKGDAAKELKDVGEALTLAVDALDDAENQPALGTITDTMDRLKLLGEVRRFIQATAGPKRTGTQLDWIQKLGEFEDQLRLIIRDEHPNSGV